MHPFSQFITTSGIMAPNSPIAPYLPWIIIALVIWELIWKGVALWHSARNNQRVWYFFILVLNTVGILPILYIIFFRKNKNNVVHTTTVVHTVTSSTPTPDGTVQADPIVPVI